MMINVYLTHVGHLSLAPTMASLPTPLAISTPPMAAAESTQPAARLEPAPEERGCRKPQ